MLTCGVRTNTSSITFWPCGEIEQIPGTSVFTNVFTRLWAGFELKIIRILLPFQRRRPLPLAGASVTVRPDWIETRSSALGKQVLIRRIKTGRRSKSAVVDPVVMLYQFAAKAEFPNATRSFDTLFLLTGEEWPVDSKDEQVRKGVEKYQDAADGIRAGEFEPKPNERTCPKCPHYFICPGKAEE